MSTLDLLLSTAVVNGLRQFSVTRIGTAKIEWQAATRWHGRDGYCVAICETPEQAATEALSAHPLPSGASPPPAIPNFTYPPERQPTPEPTKPAPAPVAPSLDDWDAPEEAPTAEPEAGDDLDGW